MFSKGSCSDKKNSKGCRYRKNVSARIFYSKYKSPMYMYTVLQVPAWVLVVYSTCTFTITERAKSRF